MPVAGVVAETAIVASVAAEAATVAGVAAETARGRRRPPWLLDPDPSGVGPPVAGGVR
jgi:hypothetical protein